MEEEGADAGDEEVAPPLTEEDNVSNISSTRFDEADELEADEE